MGGECVICGSVDGSAWRRHVAPRKWCYCGGGGGKRRLEGSIEDTSHIRSHRQWLVSEKPGPWKLKDRRRRSNARTPETVVSTGCRGGGFRLELDRNSLITRLIHTNGCRSSCKLLLALRSGVAFARSCWCARSGGCRSSCALKGYGECLAVRAPEAPDDDVQVGGWSPCLTPANRHR